MVSRIDGNVRVAGQFSAGSYSGLTRASLEQDVLYYPIDLGLLRVHDAYASFLPNAGASDDLGLVGGTFGTGVPSIQTGDLKNAGSTDRYARFLVRIPPEFQNGKNVSLRLMAGMLTTVASATAVVDVEAYLFGGDTLVDGGDLCATSAQSINSLSFANKEFVITSTGLVAGDLLDVRVRINVNDSATVTAVIGAIAAIELGVAVKG